MTPDTQSKLVTLVQSRKFWALIFGLIGIAATYFPGVVTPQVQGALDQAISLITAAYIVGTAIEDHGNAVKLAAPAVTTINVPASDHVYVPVTPSYAAPPSTAAAPPPLAPMSGGSP